MMKYDLPKALLLAMSLNWANVSANTLYMPEGYVGEGIEEFIAILNPQENEANGTVTIYYEDGTKLEGDVSFPPMQRSGLTLKDIGVEWNRPFSTVIETDETITATLIHYDNGSALGANFTEVTSTKWSIAEGVDQDLTRDFLSIFNPNESAVEINVSLLKEGSSPQDFTINMGGERRFAFNLHEYVDRLGWFNEKYGVLLEADEPIVVSLSHYDGVLGDGTLVMGHPDHGQSSGYIAEGWISEEGFEYISVLNPNEYGITLDFNIQYNTGITEVIEDVWVSGNQRIGYRLNNRVTPNQGFMIKYTAEAANNWEWEANRFPEPGTPANVVANFVHFDLSGLNGVRFRREPHTRWEFAEGYRSDLPDQVYEFLLMYNPNEEDAEVNVTLIYDDGQEPTVIPLTVEAGKKDGLALHSDERVRIREGGIWYGIVVESDVPIVPYFTHYDLSFGGSFALEGSPR